MSKIQGDWAAIRKWEFMKMNDKERDEAIATLLNRVTELETKVSGMAITLEQLKNFVETIKGKSGNPFDFGSHW